jgi:hypothetical protein
MTAIDTAFEFLCMIVDKHTPVEDYKRHTIVAIHQTQNYAELIGDVKMLQEANNLEKQWYEQR